MIRDKLTIDIDHYERNARLRALRAWYALHRLDVVDEVVVAVSSGGKGIHIEGRLSEILEAEERKKIRMNLCDDAKRAHLDGERGDVGHMTDIFWTEKDGNDGERERVEDIWAAFDRIERAPRNPHKEAKAVAKHGHKAVWRTHGFNRASLVEAHL